MMLLLKLVVFLLAVGVPAVGFGLAREAWARRRNRVAEAHALTTFEQSQAAPAVARVSMADLEERRRSAAWKASFDAAIADLNARFDAIVADLEASGDRLPLPMPPLVALYDLDGSAPVAVNDVPATPVAREPILDELARFDPAGALEVIREQNEQPTVFSWHTQELPAVELAELFQPGTSGALEPLEPMAAPAHSVVRPYVLALERSHTIRFRTDDAPAPRHALPAAD
jgi:hypothetical protein